MYKDDFEGADDPNDLLENAFGGPNEPQRYVGDGLGRVNKGKKSHRKGGVWRRRRGNKKQEAKQQQSKIEATTSHQY